MTPEQAASRVGNLGRHRPRALQLARLLSLAATLEPMLIRRIRLGFAPQLNAGDEADVWFSNLVQAYSPAGIVFFPEIAQQLRTELPVPLREPIWKLTQQLHAGASQAIRIEEELTYLAYDPQAHRDRINTLLDSLVGSLMSGRSDLANWAGRALPRLPPSLRAFDTLSVLGVASDLRLRKAGNMQRTLSALGHIPPWISRTLLPNSGRVRLRVTLTKQSLSVGPEASFDDPTIEAPDTPVIPVEIRSTRANEQSSQMLFLKRDQTAQTELLDSTVVELVTLANQKWTLSRVQAAQSTSVAPPSIRTFTDGISVTIHWALESAIPGCVGFRLMRRRQGEGSSPEEPAEALGGVIPLQRFSWIDRPSPRGAAFAYRVIPLRGSPPSADALESLASGWTPPIRVGPQAPTEAVVVNFNRTLDSPRELGLTAESIDPKADFRTSIANLASPVRHALGGDLLASLISLLTEAYRSEAEIYVAMFEISDPQLIALIASFGSRASVILPGDFASKVAPNHLARQVLVNAKVNIIDRGPPARGLAHNKFVVIQHPASGPVTVWTGNVTWSDSALCARSNAAVTVNDTKVATVYLEQWHLLATDPSAAALTTANSATLARLRSVPDTIRAVFSPVPGRADVLYVRQLIEQARQGVLFLLSEPGNKSEILRAIERQSGLYKLGAARSGPTLSLYRRDGMVRRAPTAQSFPVLELFSVQKTPSVTFGTSLQSRMILIDPVGIRPIVVIGSHSFSDAGSRVNDENFLVLEGFPDVARRCAAHIEGYCEHFSRPSEPADGGPVTAIDSTDRWQNNWLAPSERIEIDFWMGSLDRGVVEPAQLETRNSAPPSGATRPSRRKRSKSKGSTTTESTVRRPTKTRTTAKRPVKKRSPAPKARAAAKARPALRSRKKTSKKK